MALLGGELSFESVGKDLEPGPLAVIDILDPFSYVQAGLLL